MAGTFVKVGLRAFALLCTIIFTGLIGNVIASNVDAASSATKAINFSMFVAAWAWIAILWGLVAAFLPSLGPSIVMLPLEILAVLFTFIDAIVLSAKLRAIDCGNIDAQNLPSSWIAFGSHSDEKRCREIQAGLVFMWFLWAAFTALLVFTVMEARSGFGGFRGSRGSSRPNMSQVGV